MATDPLAAWLVRTLPPESGPYLQWASQHLPAIAPILIAALALIAVGSLRLIDTATRPM